jgi:hypothetical protein
MTLCVEGVWILGRQEGWVAFAWRGRCIPFYVHTSVQPEIVAALEKAAEMMRAPCSDIDIRIVGTTTQTLRPSLEGPNMNIIFLVPDYETLERYAPGTYPYADPYVALPLAFSSGEIRQAVIAFVGDIFEREHSCLPSFRRADPVRVAMTAFASVLGLGASDGQDSVTYSERLGGMQTLENSLCLDAPDKLQANDVGQLCSMYPIGRESNPCRSFSVGFADFTDGVIAADVRATCD